MSKTHEELLNELLGDLKDKAAADVWGPLAKKFAEEDKDRPTFWKRQNGPVEGSVLKVYMKQNYEKTGENPALDLQTPTGVVTVELRTTVLKKEAARLLIQAGDRIRITPGPKPAGKNYFNDTIERIEQGAPKNDEVPF